MIKHIVMAKFRPEISQQQQVEAMGKMGQSLGKIPGVKNLTMGPPLALEGQPAYSGVMLIDFDDEAKSKAYLEHPTHKAIEAQAQACAAISW